MIKTPILDSSHKRFSIIHSISGRGHISDLNGIRLGAMKRKELLGGFEISLADLNGRTECVIRAKLSDGFTVFTVSDAEKKDVGHIKTFDDIEVVEMEDDTKTPLFRTVIRKGRKTLSVWDPKNSEKVYAEISVPTASGNSYTHQVLIVDNDVYRDKLLPFTVVLSVLI